MCFQQEYCPKVPANKFPLACSKCNQKFDRFCSNLKCFQLIIPRCCNRCTQIEQRNRLCHDCIWVFSCARCGAKKTKETGWNGENDLCITCEQILSV